MSKLVPLSQGKVAIVDDEDYEAVSRFKWSYSKTKSPHRSYAVRCWREQNKQHGIRLHQFILGRQKLGLDIDHLNGDGLDNRKCNLRIITRSQNNLNGHKLRSSKKSKYRGVSWHGQTKKWAARIYMNRKSVSLGLFDSENKAHEAYEKKRAELCAQSAPI